MQAGVSSGSNSFRYPLSLLAAFAVAWAALAIKPSDRHDWILENVLTVLFIAGLAWTARRFRLSNVSYTLIFVFLCLHTVGAHYTYAQVPYDAWLRHVFGRSLSDVTGWRRNHFDRLVHFCFGFLLAYPIREIFCRVAGARGFWGYYLPLDLTMSFSMLYELIEWGTAEAFGGDLGQAYLGTQGDVWDAQKDMAMASLGALISMTVVALINWKFDTHFGDEWRHSLSVKDASPMGEVKLRELRTGPRQKAEG
jgi:putative membrane protein